MPHPLLDHVQGHTVHSRIDPEPMPQSLRAVMWRVRDARLNHDRFHDLPDADPADIPDQGGREEGRALLGVEVEARP